MPELPEVEILKEELSREVVGRRVREVAVFEKTEGQVANVYTDEVLFRARLHPQRRASELSEGEVERLHGSILEELQRGLELGGSSEMAFLHLDGSAGSYQESFQVKGRKEKPCFVCATPIERVKVGGRGTYFCPQCQASYQSSS